VLRTTFSQLPAGLQAQIWKETFGSYSHGEELATWREIFQSFHAKRRAFLKLAINMSTIAIQRQMTLSAKHLLSSSPAQRGMNRL
jgi:hypothetical protein